VQTLPTSELDERTLVTLMVGRPIEDLFAGKASEIGPVALRCAGFGSKDKTSNLRLHRREIVGLAGLEGQGQRELIRAIAGVGESPRAGVEKVDRAERTQHLDPESDVRRRLAHGIGFVPGDRKSEGLYLDLSVSENIVIGTYKDAPLAAYASSQTSLIADAIARIGLRAKNPKLPIQALSGGNQQKALLARALVSGVDTLLVEEPTRGVDIGAKAEIYRLLRSFAEDEGVVLVSSSELTELIGLCDRILVVREGQIVAEIDSSEATEESVMSHALGATQPNTQEASC
jgi:ribose transport system ATP-binding protein